MQLTELEGCALGLTWQLGPCPAYAIKRQFELSNSSSWSASAGTVYPLMKKLERLHLIDGRDDLSNPAKRRRIYTITAAGRAQLIHWMSTLPEWAGEAVPEPIRTRTFFLSALGPEERLAFLQDAKARTERMIASLEAAVTSAEDKIESLASLGALFELRARAEWLDIVTHELSQQTRPIACASTGES